MFPIKKYKKSKAHLHELAHLCVKGNTVSATDGQCAVLITRHAKFPPNIPIAHAQDGLYLPDSTTPNPSLHTKDFPSIETSLERAHEHISATITVDIDALARVLHALRKCKTTDAHGRVTICVPNGLKPTPMVLVTEHGKGVIMPMR